MNYQNPASAANQAFLNLVTQEKFPTCKHLDLIPHSSDLPMVEEFARRIVDASKGKRIIDFEEIRFMEGYLLGVHEGIGSLRGLRQYELRCSKNNDLCVGTISPVMSMAHGMEGYQLMNSTIAYSPERILHCKNFERWETKPPELGLFEFFIFSIPQLREATGNTR